MTPAPSSSLQSFEELQAPGRPTQKIGPEELGELIGKSPKLVFLTGAGVSTASGIPDFQTTDASWSYALPRTEMISLPYFLTHPESFWKVYSELFMGKLEAQPNEVHHWIASLEKDHRVVVATQNVDGLHAMAESTNVLECHGSIWRVVCLPCRVTFPTQLFLGEDLPTCPHCGSPLKPDVSLFMDEVHCMEEAARAIGEADLLLVVGTSLRVGPFNELPLALPPGIPSLWMDQEEPPGRYGFTYGCLGELTTILGEMEK